MIRHAQAFHNTDPNYNYGKSGKAHESPLTSLGVMQSLLLNKFVSKFYKDKSKKIAIICSPYLRTLMTTFISLHDLHKGDIYVDPSPGEIYNPGRSISFLKQYFDKRFWNRLDFLGLDKNNDWSDKNSKVYLNRVAKLRQLVSTFNKYDYVLIYSHGSFMHYGFGASRPGNTSVFKFNDISMKNGKFVYHWQGRSKKELSQGYSQPKVPLFSK